MWIEVRHQDHLQSVSLFTQKNLHPFKSSNQVEKEEERETEGERERPARL
jgi:hypothetical protein